MSLSSTPSTTPRGRSCLRESDLYVFGFHVTLYVLPQLTTFMHTQVTFGQASVACMFQCFLSRFT